MKTEYSFNDILKIAHHQLAEWKPKLSAECFAALEKKASDQWATNPRPMDIFRGCQMTEFILNWSPKSKK